MLASSPVILLAFNSHFCDAILTLESKRPDKPANQTLSKPQNHLKPLTPDNPMNAFASSSPAKTTSTEPSLGWNAMPAYGEVLSEMRGLSHLDINAPLAPEPRANNMLIESFWNSLIRSNMVAAA
jgi:hypothetical protein